MERPNGFVFSKLLFPYYEENAIKIEVGKHSVSDYVSYINEHKIEQAVIIMPDIHFLLECPTLKYLKIGMPSTQVGDFDFSPLYKMPEVKSLQINSSVCSYNLLDVDEIPQTDYSRIKGLQKLSLTAHRGALNFDSLDTLKSLTVGCYANKSKNLRGLFSSKQLDTLSLLECKEHSMDGIEVSEKMQYLYISYNRSLRDINALRKVKHSLKALQIHNCPKIEDFSVLEELVNLESLMIIGNNKLPNLQFLKKLKKLTRFVFDVSVEDGDLTPCMDINHVVCHRHKRHYNVKSKDLPQGLFLRGNEDIDVWRRLE